MNELLSIYIPPLNKAGFRYIRAAEVSRFVAAKDLSGLWQRHVLSKLTTSNQD
jgi:hypothetical protein